MMLQEVLEGVESTEVSGDLRRDISGISYDSRKVHRDHLFVAIQGDHLDGHDFIGDAVQRGAGAVLHERLENAAPAAGGDTAVTLIRVRDSRSALAHVSHNFFGKPSQSIATIGVTGTNGKTTTTYIIKSVLEAWGKKVGLIGTIQYMIDNEVYSAEHTTPEALEFQELLSRMFRKGCDYAVSEVSSHALAQKRVDRTDFRVGIFTNLTRDHLDFHKTMDEYYLAKQRLFAELLHPDGCAVINRDDPFGRTLAESLQRGLGRKRRVLTYGCESGADLRASGISTTFDGLRFTVEMQGTRYQVEAPLTGLPNVYNILAAAAAGRALGVPWESILSGVREAKAVTGRFEKVDLGQPFLAVVDYAHTGDALERLILTARGLGSGRIITVFGCGGDRDRGKRPEMGAIATRLSDVVIITSDNPRSEEAGAIIEEITAGAVRANYLVEPDRKEAIRKAAGMASAGDMVLVAGKGHEKYQEVGGKRFPFSDREVLEEAIRRVTGGV